ncbi:MAG TPA: lipopolysaccharide biosynthesis protein, partial [Albitalea sp.]|nr:lipopolysaccharide biosynthesis protein [Albitalea sp.]
MSVIATTAPGTGQRAVGNARWIAVSQAGRVATQLIAVAVLARLLAPADFGLMAMAATVTTLASMLRDMGTGAAVIQKERLDDATVTAVFWFNLCMGLAIAAAIALGSPLIAAAFRHDTLVPVLCALALVFPLTSSTTAHQALLERSSSFRLLARIEISSGTAGLAVAVLAAALGAGVYSLVLQSITAALLSSVQLWLASRWRPHGRPLWSGLRGIAGFSGNLAGFNFINYFARNADSMIIGRFLGAAALGAYAVAYRLMLFPLQNLSFIATRALLPVMSRQQNDPAAMAGLYLRCLSVIATLAAPLMAGAFVLREPLIHLLAGPGWQTAADILFWLAPTGFVQSIVSTIGTVLMARGRTDILMRIGVVSAVVQVAAFLAGLRFGVVGVAAFHCAANLLIALPFMHIVLRQVGESLRSLAAVLWAPMLSAALMAGALAALRASGVLSPLDTASSFAVCVLAGALLYPLLLAGVFRQDLRQLLVLVE